MFQIKRADGDRKRHDPSRQEGAIGNQRDVGILNGQSIQQVLLQVRTAEPLFGLVPHLNGLQGSSFGEDRELNEEQ